MFSPKNDVAANKWAWRDVNAMAGSCGADPVFVDAARCEYNSLFHSYMQNREDAACTIGACIESS